MKKVYLLLLSCLTISFAVRSQNIFSENFDDVSTLLSTGGWTQINNSYPLGYDIWHQESFLHIQPQNGSPGSCAEVGFHSVSDTAAGTISNWLITPPITLVNGYKVSFYTTSLQNYQLPDRLELRLNASNTTNVGSSATSTGDFNVALLTVNPNLVASYSDYPVGYWGQYSATVTGLSSATPCRIAFRYFVTNAGQSGTKASYIGVDAFSVDGPNAVDNLSSEKPSVVVYPNPLKERLTVDFVKPLAEDGAAHIYNSIGKLIYSFPVAKGQLKASFSVKDFAVGVYIISVQTSSNAFRTDFIKE